MEQSRDWLNAVDRRLSSKGGGPTGRANDDRDVVGRLVVGARALVDRGDFEAVGGGRREQQVIDADAVVLLPGAGLVVPERIMARLGMAGAQGVRQAEIDQTPIGSAAFRLVQRVVDPERGVLRILGLRDNVEVAGKNEHLLGGQPFAGMASKRPIQASL